ncbi:TDT family transporter [Shewanella sedimentimangrovi]|uniref:TDT family transporter n=1 Tax=Shewanella sedimentimangrovi TaxID=2814293 RepID=A0ABX7QWL2_9GAMM|nr:TDT family transporter [Shewanella sedimentimangrovi]QSX35892.1 TDT family transporter [Shewanella sedimentimangrovi]
MNSIPALVSRIAHLPSPLGGLALAIAGLGWSLENLGPGFNGQAQLMGALLATPLLLLLLAKFVLHPRVLWQELSHPLLGSVLPTFAMGLMTVSNCLGQYAPRVASGVWTFAVLVHICFFTLFAGHRLRRFKLTDMAPSWFVPPVGIIVAAFAMPTGANLALAQGLLGFGLISYALLLPLMLYRLIVCAPLATAAQPSLAILAAPASLSLAGYLSVTQQVNPIVIALLLPLALLMTSVVYLAAPTLLRLPFSPGYAAFTFPLVIGATALFKVSAWMSANGMTELSVTVHDLALVELLIACLTVLWVSICFFRYFFPTAFAKTRQPTLST